MSADAHRTHLEWDGTTWYWWCEADDCYAATDHRYPTEREATDAAAIHERWPG